MKKNGLVCFLFLLLLLPAGAEQITKIAVLDYSRVLSAFYKDSRAVRELEELKAVYQEDIRRMQSEIIDLEDRKLTAQTQDNSQSALRLDQLIQEKKQFLQDFVRVKGAQLQERVSKLNESLSLAKEILQEIQFVAESNGYSLVLKRSDPNLVWWTYEVDITEEVLQRLMRPSQP